MGFRLNNSQRIVCWIAVAIIAAIQTYDFLENGIGGIGWIVSLAVIFVLTIIALNKDSVSSANSNAATTTIESPFTSHSATSTLQHDQLVSLLVKSIKNLASEIREELKRINPKLVTTHPKLGSLAGLTSQSTKISYCTVFIAFNSEPQLYPRSRQLSEARDLIVNEMCRTEIARLNAELDSDDRKIMVSTGQTSSEQNDLRNELKGLNDAKVVLLRTLLNSDLKELETAGRIAITNLKQGSPDSLNPLYLALRRFMVGNKSISDDDFASEYGAIVQSWIAKARQNILGG